MKFSEKLKKVREILNISQEFLARELDVSFATINRLENDKGHPSYETIVKFEEFCKNNKVKCDGDVAQ